MITIVTWFMFATTGQGDYNKVINLGFSKYTNCVAVARAYQSEADDAWGKMFGERSAVTYVCKKGE